MAAAQAAWDLENQKAFDLLMLALSNCPEGQTVLSAFEYNPAIADIADPKKYADDDVVRTSNWSSMRWEEMTSPLDLITCVFCST